MVKYNKLISIIFELFDIWNSCIPICFAVQRFSIWRYSDLFIQGHPTHYITYYDVGKINIKKRCVLAWV